MGISVLVCQILIKSSYFYTLHNYFGLDEEGNSGKLRIKKTWKEPAIVFRSRFITETSENKSLNSTSYSFLKGAYKSPTILPPSLIYIRY